MTNITTTPAPQPLFIPITKFQLYGLPAKTTAYKLAELGLLDLTKNVIGRVGVTIEEARRFVSTPLPGPAKRDTTRGTIASLRARGHDQAADRLEKRQSQAA